MENNLRHHLVLPLGIEEGTLIRIKGMKNKRIRGRVIDIDSMPYEHILKLKAVYVPAPKSLLRKKRIFTKTKSKYQIHL